MDASRRSEVRSLCESAIKDSFVLLQMSESDLKQLKNDSEFLLGIADDVNDQILYGSILSAIKKIKEKREEVQEEEKAAEIYVDKLPDYMIAFIGFISMAIGLMVFGFTRQFILDTFFPQKQQEKDNQHAQIETVHFTARNESHKAKLQQIAIEQTVKSFVKILISFLFKNGRFQYASLATFFFDIAIFVVLVGLIRELIYYIIRRSIIKVRRKEA